MSASRSLRMLPMASCSDIPSPISMGSNIGVVSMRVSNGSFQLLARYSGQKGYGEVWGDFSDGVVPILLPMLMGLGISE
eukprot:1195139-Prorocentrum_minimum.AAC.3